MNVSGAVLRLWKAVPREVRLSFERHPVDDVRTLEAERDQLREDLEWNVAEADRVAKALIEQVAYANRYRTTLVEIANGVHGMASVLAARALDPTEVPR